MEKVIVYTQADCRYSRLLVDCLNSESVLFEERNIEDHIHRKQAANLGALTIPFTVVGGTGYSGYDLSLIPRIRAWQKQGGAMSMIKFINESTGKEVFRLDDEGNVKVDGALVTDMTEITKAAEEAQKEEE